MFLLAVHSEMKWIGSNLLLEAPLQIKEDLNITSFHWILTLIML